eukprot:41197-Prymnesium_polylepis.1
MHRSRTFRRGPLRSQANPWAVNDAYDTPLLLAAACRSLKMVRVAMNVTKQTLWTFGPVRGPT